MKKNTLVSVIIPLYNKEKWIGKCINSVLKQTYQVFEILVVDDGSTDNSLEVVNKIKDERIKIIRKKNEGVSTARNLGLKKAKGEIIAFLDADDYWNNKHLEYALKGFELGENVVLSANYFSEDHKESFSLNSIFGNKKLVCCKINFYFISNYLNLLSDNLFIVSSSSVLVKNNIIKKYNLRFENDLRIGEDINFWLKLNRYGNFAISDYLGAFYNHGDDNSLMFRQEKDVKFIPDYFKNIETSSYNKEELKLMVKFLSNEFYKKAFQNRGKSFIINELKTEYNNYNFCLSIKFKYLIIRFMPNFLINILK